VGPICSTVGADISSARNMVETRRSAFCVLSSLHDPAADGHLATRWIQFACGIESLTSAFQGVTFHATNRSDGTPQVTLFGSAWRHLAQFDGQDPGMAPTGATTVSGEPTLENLISIVPVSSV
jgi:hypothetical protein